MSAPILSVREGLRQPGTYLNQLVRHPGKHIRHLVRHPRKAILGERGSSKDSPQEPKLMAPWPWQAAPKVPAVMPNGFPWPRISIVTPSYNQGAYIEETIRSVLMQGYPNLQYIVIDGGSTDQTQVILRRYANEVDLIISESDTGQSSAINKGFQYADGEILAWLNSDDMHLPNTLVSVALAFESVVGKEAAEQVDLVCGRICVQDQRSGTMIQHTNRFAPGIHPLPKDMNDFNGVWQTSPGFFYQPEVFFSRRIWNKVGSSVNSLLHYALDYDLWIRMSKHNASILSLETPLAIFRVHDDQKTKFESGTKYPEHQAVSTFHRANPSPEAAYVPAELQYEIRDTLPPNIFSKLPLSCHETALGKFYVPCLAQNDIIANHMKVGRVFEPEIVETAKLFIKPGSLVLDVGANFGQMSILFSNFAGKDGMVFSFEAQEYCHAILLKNIAANQKENIRAFHAAVFDRSRNEVEFPEPTFNRFPSYGSFPVSLDSSAPAGQPAPASQRIKTLAIDDMKIEWPISFFKIDIQGSDLFALRGARETILRHRMPILFEYEEQFQKDFGTGFEDYIEFIHSIGYRIDRVVNGINYLALPDEKLAQTPIAASEPAVRNDIIEVTRPAFRKHLNKFLKNRGEVHECTKYLHYNGYVSHNLTCKDWDIALIVPEIGDGNMLDMGSSDSYILKNLCLKRTKGKKYGIDYNDPDVPLSEVNYIKGNLMQTPLPDGHLQYISCLSVIEHQVDFRLFAQEVNRLLSRQGKLFVTYDYWEPLLSIPVKAYGLDWQPLDRARVELLIAECKKENLHLTDGVDWETGEALIRWGYYSPHPEVAYTFGLLVFEKQ